MLDIQIKSFDQLTIPELYNVLQLRTEVFVVEQDCVYQDIDGKDQKALHILGIKDGIIIAYSRIFKPGDYFNEASIGRIVVQENERHNTYGKSIVEASVEAIKENFKTQKIRISAQTYLKTFYNSMGFIAEGEEYLEDGIPHVNMVLN